MTALNDREREILAFERLRWSAEGAKEEEIRRRFGVEPWRYFQQLNALIERPEAREEDPVTVRILLERRG
ncbi:MULTISPECIES: DUF3263 domain-containing protein [Corynebacterium]|jgi:hypothetical protein|uniref:DUF3263 domain-containing protein n=1 Tax=Corynebacterium provencense TaxID=1737425 RepID=A0A2Z3YY60_9CORY|nr:MULTISPECIES: DUF3263 domain-containing protein [Corynebacterium]AWT27027.1 hypothetical protein Csp1_22770 [Corynebacterium provencense]MCI1255203.1 DUF3263 domain-containing protein [Corynebacterium provencense]